MIEPTDCTLCDEFQLDLYSLLVIGLYTPSCHFENHFSMSQGFIGLSKILIVHVFCIGHQTCSNNVNNTGCNYVESTFGDSSLANYPGC